MVYDPAQHILDPQTGFIVHKDLGHRIGLEPAPVRTETTEFPKWVEVHESHLDGGVAQEFAQTEHTRAGLFRVLVNDAEEEAKAIAEKVGLVKDHPTPPPPVYQPVTHIPLAEARDDPEHKAIGIVEDAHVHEQHGLDEAGFHSPTHDDPSHGHEIGGITGLPPAAPVAPEPYREQF